jgi:competence protein ComFC
MTGLSLKNESALHLSNLFWTAMDWLYPPHCCNCEQRGFVLCSICFSQIDVLHGKLCSRCGYPIGRKKTLCAECRSNPPVFTEMRSWSAFSGVCRKAIHTLKYRQNIALGRILAKPLIEMIRKSDWQFELIVPVPLSRSHQRQRGYNQAACISRVVARELNIPHSTMILKRIKETETQISLDVNKRFTNLMDAFYAIPAKLNKSNVLVIDDVITTGATMQNCAIALKNAGAEKVYCLSVARTLLHHPKNS